MFAVAAVASFMEFAKPLDNCVFHLTAIGNQPLLGSGSVDPAPPYPESPSAIVQPPTYQAATAHVRKQDVPDRAVIDTTWIHEISYMHVTCMS